MFALGFAVASTVTFPVLALALQRLFPPRVVIRRVA